MIAAHAALLAAMLLLTACARPPQNIDAMPLPCDEHPAGRAARKTLSVGATVLSVVLLPVTIVLGAPTDFGSELEETGPWGCAKPEPPR